jgi:hypothetical protein
VEPWLGERAAIFLTPGASLETEGSRLLSTLRQGLLGAPAAQGGIALRGLHGAVVLDVSDPGRARSFVRTRAARDGAHLASYRRVAYRVGQDGTAFGLVGDFLVIGSETALRGVIDTKYGAPSLSRAPDYARLAVLAPANAVAHVYVGASAAAAGGSGSPQALLHVLTGGAPANVSLLLRAGSIALDADALGQSAGGGLFAADPAAVRALGELPGESFLALGFGPSRLGSHTRLLGALAGEQSGAEPTTTAGLSLSSIVHSLLAPLRALTEGGAAARRDFASWMGAGGIFASGSGLLDLRAGVVIASSDAARSRAAVERVGARLRAARAVIARTSIAGTEAALEARLAGLPVALDIAAGRDASGQAKFVVGVGAASVTAALQPASTLRGSSSLGGASALLGEGMQPSALVQVPTLVGVLEGVGLTEDASVAPLLPYLRALTTVTAGSRSLGGGAQRVRLVARLRQGG